MQAFAWHVGQAFQLLDDLKDQQLVASEGKDLGQDAGKPTLLALLRPPAARAVLNDHLRAVDESLHRTFSGNDALPTLVRQMFALAAAGQGIQGCDQRCPNGAAQALRQPPAPIEPCSIKASSIKASSIRG
jgi:geranylgeranyl diphosphate synthase type II